MHYSAIWRGEEVGGGSEEVGARPEDMGARREEDGATIQRRFDRIKE
jgi:hypothetical protein